MIDTFLKSKNKASLEALNGSVINMIPVAQGRPAQTTTLEDGTEWIKPVCGDPDYFYTCVRAVFPVPAFDDVELSSFEEAASVCGVWV